MKRIEAALPALGNYIVPFHKESEEVLLFLGEKELNRLDRVQHLGVASRVFTGVNHSRLEYTLLLCAVINLLPKFQKGNENFALSGTVRIPGQVSKISSGEELLKCWALLSNAGHAQYTYGVERSLLNFARADENFKKLLVERLPRQLRRWSLSVIEEYRDTAFHYLLALLRISFLPQHSRTKARLYRVLAALLLPLEQLTLSDSADKYKLFRLRRLFDQVRLLCIVTLDAYYSHHPVRYQLSGALMNLGTLMEEIEGKSEFAQLMEQTAAWLADEIYFHPKAAAAQKHYEIISATKLAGVYKPRLTSGQEFQKFFQNFMESGFGQPKVDQLRPLARLSFPRWRFGAVFGRDEYTLVKTVESQLSNSSSTHVSVLFNPYSKTFHFDLLYDKATATSACVSKLTSRAIRWLSRLVEAQALWRIRSLRVPENAQADLIERLRKRFLDELVEGTYPALKSLFNGIVRYVLPDYMIGAMSEVMPRNGQSAIGLRLNYVRGGAYDSLTSTIDELISKNPNACTDDRLHELKAVQHFVSKSKAPVVMACLEKFIVRDMDGRHIDDWDGLVLEIFEEHITLSVIEAKNLKSSIKSENQAFQQLADTRELVTKKRKLKSRRKRIPGLGAVITFNF